jgi:hypothetical protein
VPARSRSAGVQPNPTLVFIFVIVYAALLFVVRPNPTAGQVVFRVGMMAVGVIGLVMLRLRGRRR